MTKRALITRGGRYRLWLLRRWDDTQPLVLFVGLNPSTADMDVDDATIRKMIRMVKGWKKFGGFGVVNLFAYRSVTPDKLKTVKNPIGAKNDGAIQDAALLTGYIVACWGNKGTYLGRDEEVLTLLRRGGWLVRCLGLTKSGCPRHPLYLSNKTHSVIWK